MAQHELDTGWQQADKQLEPALVLIWAVGIVLAALLATAL